MEMPQFVSDAVLEKPQCVQMWTRSGVSCTVLYYQMQSGGLPRAGEGGELLGQWLAGSRLNSPCAFPALLFSTVLYAPKAACPGI